MLAYLQLPTERLTIGIKLEMQLSFLRVTDLPSKKLACYFVKNDISNSNSSPVVTLSVGSCR